MEKIIISCIAFENAPETILEEGKSLIKDKISDEIYDFSSKNPDIIFVLSGGSEAEAKRQLNNKKHVVIIGLKANNGFAAAMEIRAYCSQIGINALLIDTENEDLKTISKLLYRIKNAELKIKSYKLGLIGEISEWLIASKVEGKNLTDKFGISLEKIFWDHYPDYFNFETNQEFVSHFKNSNEFNINDSSKVYNLLSSIIKEKKLDAITVECFPMVKKHAVTACLALSKFNENGFPAGCEGDITSIVGMILGKELTNQIPWMANLIAISKESVSFAHCTIATDLVSDYTIQTHFETNLGTAVQGQLKAETVTIFRLNRDLNEAFISYGQVNSRPTNENACRTQIVVGLPQSDLLMLKQNPLGNHHLIIPGNHQEILKYYFELKKIKVIN